MTESRRCPGATESFIKKYIPIIAPVAGVVLLGVLVGLFIYYRRRKARAGTAHLMFANPNMNAPVSGGVATGQATMPTGREHADPAHYDSDYDEPSYRGDRHPDDVQLRSFHEDPSISEA